MIGLHPFDPATDNDYAPLIVIIWAIVGLGIMLWASRTGREQWLARASESAELRLEDSDELGYRPTLSPCRRSSIVELELPALDELGPEPELPGELYQRRRRDLRTRMREAGLDLLALYADREHFANGSYLTGFDPRFEEALVVLDMESVKVLAGNELISLVSELPGEVSECFARSSACQARIARRVRPSPSR